MPHFKDSEQRHGLGFGPGAYQGDEHLPIEPQVLAQVEDTARNLPPKSASSLAGCSIARSRQVAAVIRFDPFLAANLS